MKINHYLWLIGMLFIGLSLPCMPYAAEDPYTIDNIAVTAKGASATEAREIATASAEKQAFTTLLERIGITSSPDLQPADISALVTGMEVHNEKITPGYYSAIMSISFNPNMVAETLHTSNIQPSQNSTELAVSTSSSSITVTIPIANLSAWVEIQKKLDAIDLIERMSLERVSSIQATIHLYFSVPYDILVRRLEEMSLTLTRTDTGFILTASSPIPTPSQQH